MLLTQCLYLGNSLAALDSQLEETLICALPLTAGGCTHGFGKTVQKVCGTCLPHGLSAVAAVTRMEMKT